MGVIKRNQRVSFNSSGDDESISDSGHGSNSITFNRFLNSNHRAGPEANIASSEDEQQPMNGSSLIRLIELDLRRSARKSPKKRRITRAQAQFVCCGVRGKSDRKKKRFENANLLSNPFLSKLLINDADIYKELDIYDFVPKTVSPFALLLTDQDSMKVWNDFNDLSEDEQEEMLNSFDEDERPKPRYKRDAKAEPVVVAEKEPNNNRPVKHSLASGKKCFDRINNCIKSVLRKKFIPLTYLESIEQKLLDQFKDDANSIYQTCLDSSYARLLLHACAQYHDLSCHSFDKEGDRWSQVSNKCDYFEPSLTSLTAHLERLYLESSSKK